MDKKEKLKVVKCLLCGVAITANMVSLSMGIYDNVCDNCKEKQAYYECGGYSAKVFTRESNILFSTIGVNSTVTSIGLSY